MEIVYTRPTLKITEEEYKAIHTVKSMLYELAVNAPYTVIDDLAEGVDEDNIKESLQSIETVFEFTVNFVNFIDKYGKVVKEIKK